VTVVHVASLDFSRRAYTPELMDTEDCGYEEFRACLSDLATVNRLTLTHRATLGFLDRLARSDLLPKDRPLRLVDVGSGYGDLLRRVDLWAGRRGIAVALVGIDLNPWSGRSAAEATPPGRPIRWVTGDVFEYADEPIDVVVSSQFAHHLDDAALRRFLCWMEEKARIGWLVADLHRHALPYHVFRFWSWAAGWHRFVRNDGPISITRSLSLAEWRATLAAAGLGQLPIEVAWHVPFRVSVSRIRAA